MARHFRTPRRKTPGHWVVDSVLDALVQTAEDDQAPSTSLGDDAIVVAVCVVASLALIGMALAGWL